LNKELHETRRLLASPERVHAAILACFMPNSGRVLWRLDEFEHSLFLLVISAEQPDFKHMQEKYGWNSSSGKGDTIKYDSLLSKLKDGQKFRFKLTANPASRFYKENDTMQGAKARKQGNFYGKLGIDQHNEWLISQSVRHGFSVTQNDFAVTSKGKLRFHKGQGRDRNTITLATATYEGVLQVTNVDKFRSALINGIGRGKAYGQGMLTISKTQINTQ
jgi:CRISPR system Cascade subunit CasE